MFVPGDRLKDAVFELLKDGEMSISAIYRKLDDEGIKVHRLVVTGYLRALEEMKVLRSKEIPPSKVYMLPTVKEKNLYESVGAAAKEMGATPSECTTLCVASLQRVFRRPVFLDELKLAGFTDEAGDLERVVGDERMDAKKALAKRGYNISDNNPAYKVKASPDIERKANDLLVSVITQSFEIQSLVVETKQLKLGEV